MYAQTASNPPSPVFELAEYNGFDAMPNWIDPFVGTPEERMAKLHTPGVRDRMRQDVGAWTGPGAAPTWRRTGAKMRVVEVRHPRNYQYEGITIAELAAVTGKHPMDAHAGSGPGRGSADGILHRSHATVRTRRRWRRS